MKPTKYSIMAALTFLVVAIIGGNAAAYNMAEYYPLNQGDEWSYSSKMEVVGGPFEGDYPAMPLRLVVNGTEVVNQVTTTKVEMWSFGYPTPDYDCYVMDAAGLKVYKQYWANYSGVVAIIDPGLLIFPAQFDLGEVNQQSFTVTSYDPSGTLLGTGSGNLTSSIEAVEDVRVQAGNFTDCLKFSSSSSSQMADGSTFDRDMTIWYARNVGAVKLNIYDEFYSPVDGTVTVTMANTLQSATVAGVHYGCPATLSLEEPYKENQLSLLRRFRDEVLAKDLTGTALVELYYKHAPEVSRLLLKDADQRGDTLRCLRRLLPEIASALNGEKTLLSKEMVDEIETLLDGFAGEASPRLQRVIGKLGKDMKSEAFLKRFGIILEQ